MGLHPINDWTDILEKVAFGKRANHTSPFYFCITEHITTMNIKVKPQNSRTTSLFSLYISNSQNLPTKYFFK